MNLNPIINNNNKNWMGILFKLLNLFDTEKYTGTNVEGNWTRTLTIDIHLVFGATIFFLSILSNSILYIFKT